MLENVKAIKVSKMFCHFSLARHFLLLSLMLFLNLSSSAAAAAAALHIWLKRPPSFIHQTGILSELAGLRNGAFIIEHELTVSHISVPGRDLLHIDVYYT